MMVCDSKAGDEQAKILHQELPTRGQEKTACFFLEILNIREQAECDQEGQHAKQTAQKAKTGKEADIPQVACRLTSRSPDFARWASVFRPERCLSSRKRP